MSDDKKKDTAGLTGMEIEAEAAAKLEEEAKAEGDVGVYTHVFKKPFVYQGKSYDALTFNWDTLTGADSLAIEGEMLHHGKTLVVPAFSGDYLIGMAARACTERSETGRRVVGTDLIKALPLTDFSRICGKARSFLLRAE